MPPAAYLLSYFLLVKSGGPPAYFSSESSGNEAELVEEEGSRFMPRESFHDRMVARGGLAALLPDDHPMQAWNNEYNKWCRNFVNFVLVPSAIAMWLAGWGRGGRPDGGGPKAPTGTR